MKHAIDEFTSFLHELLIISRREYLLLLLRVLLFLLFFCGIIFLITLTPFWAGFVASFAQTNNVFNRLNPFWTFLQGVGTILVLVSITIAATNYIESKKRERIKFKGEMDPLVVPQPIHIFYLKNSQYNKNFTTLNVINKERVVDWNALTLEEQRQYKNPQDNAKKLLLRSSWYETVYDILPAENPKVTFHALFYITNLRKGIANNVKIEVCGGKKDVHTWVYDFNSSHIVHEGPHYDLIEGDPIIIYKDDKYDGQVSFDKNFCLRLTYTSNYTNDKHVEVYEAVVAKGDYYILDVNNSIVPEDDSKEVRYERSTIHAEAGAFANIAYIKMFNKITDTETEKDVYCSPDIR